jgi:hypothetical protein
LKIIPNPKLDPMEFMEAVLVGAMRQAYNHLKRTPDRYGWDQRFDTWRMNIQAACAEKLVGKATGFYCIGVKNGKDDGNDVGLFGVRWTSTPDGSLILHPADRDDQIFILVKGEAPYEMEIVGWIRAEDGKIKDFWRENIKRPAFFIPQSYLRPIEFLGGAI